jgi:ABC-2 type transport system permease protein
MTVATPQSPSTEDTGPVEGTSFRTATRLIAEREMKSFLRMKGFWIGLGVLVVGLFALSILPTVFGGSQPTVATVGSVAERVLAGSELDVREVTDVAAAEELVRTEEVNGQSATGVRVLALDETPDGVVGALSTAPPVDLLDDTGVGDDQRELVTLVFGLVFLLFGMGGAAIAQSTITEKQTRIVEILVATIPVRALLAGKIVGHALLTLGQVVVLAAVAPIALRLGGQQELLAAVAPALGWFVPFLCAGFVLLAAIWAVAGSLVSRQEDLGSTMPLVMILVLGPYFGVVSSTDDDTVMTVLSYVPFSAAIAMPVRMFTGDAQAWEALVSLGLLAGTVVLVVLLASRLYSGALLQTGGRVALRRAWERAD